MPVAIAHVGNAELAGMTLPVDAARLHQNLLGFTAIGAVVHA